MELCEEKTKEEENLIMMIQKTEVWPLNPTGDDC